MGVLIVYKNIFLQGEKVKKIIILLLCVVFLYLATVSISAGVYDLAEYGQKTVTLTYPMTPLIDGKIDDGEYEVEIKLVLDEDENDDNFFINGDCSKLNAEHVIVYITADDDNIYFAVEQKDPERVSFHDAMYLQIGVGNRMDDYIQIYLPYHRWPEILTEKDKSIWSSYYSGYAASYTDDLTYYELAIPRSILEKKFDIKELDKILVSVAQRINASEDIGNVSVMWGFKNSDLASVYKQQGFPAYGYPNVLKLYTTNDTEDESLPDLPEIVLPETDPSGGESNFENDTPQSEPVYESDTELHEVTGCTVSVGTYAISLGLSALLVAFCKNKQKKK